MRIPRKAEYVAVARLAVAAVASRMRFSIEDVEDVKLAVAEACSGAIARGKRPSESVDLWCEATADTLRIGLPRFAPPEDLPELAGESSAQPRLGALGSFLIRALMDDVSYVPADDSLTLIMVKKQQRQ